MLSGKFTIKLDGATILIENAELDPGGPTYTSHTTDDAETHEVYEGTKPAVVTFDKPMDEKVDVVALSQLKNKTLTFEADTGQRYLVTKAFTVGTVKHKKTNSQMEMHGNPAEAV